MTDYFNKKEISQRAEDELLYEYVMEEMEIEPNLIKGLWAKAMAHSEGNNDKAKSLYMQYRVQSIKDDFKLLEIAYNELSKEKLWDTIKNSFGTDEEKQKIKKEQSEKKETEKYSKIRGWLIFFAIILVLGDLSYFQIFTFFTDDMKNTLETLYLNSQESIAKTINMSVYTMTIGIFFNILLTVVFFSKSKYIKPIIITFLLFQIIAGFVYAGATINLQKEFPDLLSSRDFLMEVVMRPTIGTVLLLIWMFYFIFSKRVKKTFNNEKDITSAILLSLALPVILLFTYTSKINEVSSPYYLQNKSIKLAEEYLKNNQANLAEEYFNKAIKLGYSKNKISNKYKTIANGYWTNEEYNNAEKYYNKVIKSGTNTYDIIKKYNTLADNYFDNKKYNKAIKWYKKASDDLNDNDARFRLAYSYSAIKQHYNAIKYYEKYLENNQYEGAMRNLGLVYERVEKYKKAQQWFKKAFNIYIKKGRDGDKEAAKWLALMYKYGEGTVKDYTKSDYWDKKSK